MSCDNVLRPLNVPLTSVSLWIREWPSRRREKNDAVFLDKVDMLNRGERGMLVEISKYRVAKRVGRFFHRFSDRYIISESNKNLTGVLK